MAIRTCILCLTLVVTYISTVCAEYEGSDHFNDSHIWRRGEGISDSMDHELWEVLDWNRKHHPVPESEPWNWCLVDMTVVEELADIEAHCKADPHDEKLGALAWQWRYMSPNITGVNLDCTGVNDIKSEYIEGQGAQLGCRCYMYRVNFTKEGNDSNPESYCEAPEIDDDRKCEESRLTQAMFDKASSLTVLNITHLLVKEIEDGAFHDLQGLKFLMLEYTELTEKGIPENLFCNTTNLETVVLRFNAISEFPSHIFTCTENKTEETEDEQKKTKDSEQTGEKKVILAKLKNLFLNEHFNSLPSRAFSVANNLEKLSLEYNNISILEKDTFQSLGKLRSLSLSKNPLRDLPDGIFSDLSMLMYLYLSYTSLTYFNTSVLYGLDMLRHLSIHNSHLMEVEGTLCLHVLNNVFLSHNNIERGRQEWFAGCSESPVDRFGLAHNNISKLENGSLKVQHYSDDCSSYPEFVDLSFNQIPSMEMVKAALGESSSIHKLSLSHNKIEYVPKTALPQISCLYVLVLSYNLIENIKDGAFDNLEELSELYLDGNRLDKSMDLSIFSGLENLRVLSLNENNIKNVQISGDIPNDLETLNVARNGINTLEADLFTKFKRLSHLDISFNLLKVIESQSIPATVQYLNLAGNHLYQLDLSDHGADSPNPHQKNLFILMELDLSDNRFTDIPEDMFDSVQQINKINLAHNMLKDLPDDIFLNLYSMNHLNVSHNQFELSEGLNFLPRFINNLQTLDLSWNKITDFYAVFSNVGVFSIQNVHLSGNNLGVIDPFSVKKQYKNYGQGRWNSYYMSPQLENIYLSYCNITDIDDNTFTRMTSVRYVDLSHNSLRQFDEFKTVSILLMGRRHVPKDDFHVHFDVRYNRIVCNCHMRWLRSLGVKSRSSYDIVNCTSVQTGGEVPFYDVPIDDFLCLHDCNDNLKKLNCTCHTADRLTSHRVECRNLGLTDIPAGIDATVLRLDLSGNDFSILDFSGHSFYNVKVLILSHSNIYNISSEGFDDFVSLVSIDLSYNHLENVSLDLFSNVTKHLEEIHLDHNQIYTIELFEGLSNKTFRQLRWLSLQSNQLPDINRNLLEALKHNEHLQMTLSENPYVCVNGSCDIERLQVWVLNHKESILDYENITCPNENGVEMHITKVNETVFDCPESDPEKAAVDHTTFPTITFAVAAGSSILSILGIILIVFFRFKIVVAIDKRFNVKPFRRPFTKEMDKANVDYDAFIACNHKEEPQLREWITTQLLPQLASWGYKVFYERRDGMAGDDKGKYYEDLIHKSRRSIVILSEHFVSKNQENHWPVYCFQVAYNFRQDKDKNHSIILIEFHEEYDLEGLEEKKLLTFIKREDKLSVHRKRWWKPEFWEGLHYLMPSKPLEKDGIEMRDIDGENDRLLMMEQLNGQIEGPMEEVVEHEFNEDPEDAGQGLEAAEAEGEALQMNGHIGEHVREVKHEVIIEN